MNGRGPGSRGGRVWRAEGFESGSELPHSKRFARVGCGWSAWLSGGGPSALGGSGCSKCIWNRLAGGWAKPVENRRSGVGMCGGLECFSASGCGRGEFSLSVLFGIGPRLSYPPWHDESKKYHALSDSQIFRLSNWEGGNAFGDAKAGAGKACTVRNERKDFKGRE